MTIEVLVCRGDGVQVLETRTVAEDWFSADLTGDEIPIE